MKTGKCSYKITRRRKAKTFRFSLVADFWYYTISLPSATSKGPFGPWCVLNRARRVSPSCAYHDRRWSTFNLQINTVKIIYKYLTNKIRMFFELSESFYTTCSICVGSWLRSFMRHEAEDWEVGVEVIFSSLLLSSVELVVWEYEQLSDSSPMLSNWWKFHKPTFLEQYVQVRIFKFRSLVQR